MKPVVVGIDGGVQGTRALEWAAVEAQLRRAPLHIVFGRSVHSIVPSPRMAGAPELYVPENWPVAADRELADAAARASKVAPGIEITVSREPLDPAQLLVDLGETAELLVVGAHHRTHRIGLALGVVNHTVLHHALCPIALIPDSE